jgi:cyclic pyranopterin phosphate synthase
MALETIPKAPAAEPLVDAHRRTISYLRVSVTDRCNLRCVYCMPEKGIDLVPMSDILRYEEIRDVVAVAASMGLRYVRLTGGEPLARKGLVDLVGMISALPGIEEVALTTNGVSLARYAGPLAEAGLRRVNISLDTFRPQRFRRITRVGRYEDVREGIAAARAAGLLPIKLNVVLIPGLNDDEVVDFARSTYDEGWDLRFIELMPFLEGETCARDLSPASGFVPNEEVRRQIEERLGPLAPAPAADGHGPALYHRLSGARGRIGFISPLTEEGFCARCNRLRLTATGKLRPCLLTDREIDLRAAIRGGEGEEGIRRGILAALESKPDAHHLGDGNRPRKRKMTQIGG